MSEHFFWKACNRYPWDEDLKERIIHGRLVVLHALSTIQFTQEAEADFMMGGGQLKDRDMMNTGTDRNSKH